jgi:hypothetical protein
MAMNSLQNFDYNGQIIQRRADGFVDAPQMCNTHRKKLSHWVGLKQTQEYIEALSKQTGILPDNLIELGHGKRTWIHPSLAINLARWISPEFAVWCDAHIFNLMTTGQTSLDIDPIEEMKLKIELARIEAQKETAIASAKNADLALVQFRHTITQTCPEPVQQKVLGFKVVEKVEYRDRVIANGQMINDGNGLTKTELCHRYNILTKGGKPDFRRLNLLLERVGMAPTDSDAWQMSASIQESYQFKREYLHDLDDLVISSNRQLFLGE